jgi:hypothetical protein
VIYLVSGSYPGEARPKDDRTPYEMLGKGN